MIKTILALILSIMLVTPVAAEAGVIMYTDCTLVSTSGRVVTVTSPQLGTYQFTLDETPNIKGEIRVMKNGEFNDEDRDLFILVDAKNTKSWNYIILKATRIA